MIGAIDRFLQEKITREGPIAFSDFMQTALYYPKYGYYSQETIRQSPLGDYITAPSLGPLFSDAIANYLSHLLKENPDWDIAEFGPGAGTLACNLLDTLQDRGVTPSNYHLIEPFPLPQKRLSTYLSNQSSYIQSVCKITAALPHGFRGIVLANEVLDAFPVDLLQTDSEKNLHAVCVNWENHGYYFSQKTAPSSLLTLFNSRCIPIYPDYRYELNRQYLAWLTELSHSMASGQIMIFDYGYDRLSFYHPRRSMGTLTAFHNHQTINTILENPGKIDLSAHVDFTAVAESAIEAHLQVQGYFTQSEFLFSQDIVHFYHQRRDLCDSLAGAQLHGQLQTLLHPSQMGETIKVMLLSKVRETLPDSLKSIDRAHRLAS